jgi:hypothetical protein
VALELRSETSDGSRPAIRDCTLAGLASAKPEAPAEAERLLGVRFRTET